MKLFYNVGISDDLSKLFENPDTKLGMGWRIFLELDGKKIDEWIIKNTDRIQRFKTTIQYCSVGEVTRTLTSDESHQIVYFAIQVYAFQKGLVLYMRDPDRRRLEDDILMIMFQKSFSDKALEFVEKKFLSIFYVTY